MLPALSALLAVAAACSSPSPAPQGRITDRAGVVETATMEHISQRLEEFERETCHRLFVLVLPSLEGAAIADVTAPLMKEWQVAPPPLESGLLLTVSIEEGRARIDAGTGLQDIVNSGRADAILKEDAFPLFAENRYGEGIVRALISLMAESRMIIYPEALRPDYCR